MPHSDTIFQKESFQPAVFAVFAALATVYAALFFFLYPCVPWNCDDWTYLGLFHPLLPDVARWNPARIFQEFFMPLSGYVAAYIVRPFFGLGYLEALTLTCSALAFAAWLLLSVFAYRFFFAVAGGSRVPALCGLLLLNAGFFLAHPILRLPLVISEPAPSILFAYDVPNILNAVLALTLWRAIVGDANTESFFSTPVSVSAAQKHAVALGLGLIVIYFAQFSMTIASVISAIPAGSLLLFRLTRHFRASRHAKNAGGECFTSIARKITFLDLFCCVLVAFWFIAALYDLQGGRYDSLSPAQQSFFALLALYIRALGAYIPLWLWLTLPILIMANIGILIRDRKNGTHSADNDALRIFLGVMGASFVLLLTLNMLIFHMTKIGLDNRFLFGLVFYVYVTLIVNALLLQKRVPLALVGILPLPLLLLGNVALAEPWTPRPAFYAEYRKSIVQAWLDEVTAADRAGKSEGVIRTPTQYWPHPKDYLGDRLARTLFHHGITSKHMTIQTESPDRTE